MFTLRPYQTEGVNAIRRAMAADYGAPLYVLPTGGGKTVVFTYIAQSAAAKGKRVLILVHRVELLRQTANKLREQNVRCGMISPHYTPDPFADVQVASVQTIVKRIGKTRLYFDLIIIDEAHHATAGTWNKTINAVLEVNPKCKVLGVTATPIRSDGNGLGKHTGGVFDILIPGPTISELIQMGNLVQPVVLGSSVKVSLAGVKTTAGDYNKQDLSAAVDRPKITGDAVTHYMKVCPGVPAVAFCVTVDHAKHVAAEFRAAGYRAEAVEGAMEDTERSRILNGLGNGTIDVVCSCELISEGTDIPAIGAAILLRPTKSLGLYLQQVGRALRPVPGKQCAYILDHVDNWALHGLPDDEREWTLEGSKKKKNGKGEKTIPTTMCEKCYAVFKPAPACPICGHANKPSVSSPDVVEGELVEITPEMRAQIQRGKAVEVAKAETYEDLVKIAQQRGYKPGWAKIRWDLKQKQRMGNDARF